MKTLTYWAAKNRKKAVGIMVLLHFILIFNGLYLGKLLLEKDILLNEVFLYIGIGMFVVAYFLYPVRAKKNSLFKYDLNSKVFKYSFLRHKILDVISSLAAFILITYTANISYSGEEFTGLFSRELKAADYQSVEKSKTVENTYSLTHQKDLKEKIKYSEKNSIKKLFKFKAKSKIRKIFKKQTTSTDWNFIGKMALVILLCLAATIGLAILSCYILCAGFEVLGVLVLTGGMTGLIALSIVLIKNIIRKREAEINVKKYEE